MPRGRPKQAYGNRTDLNGKIPKDAPKGMPYGEKKESLDAQSAVPMGSPEMEVMPVSEAPMAAQPEPAPTPAKPISLMEPTQRPNEDILTGMTQSRSGNPDLEQLKSLQPIFEAEAMTDSAPQIFKDFVGWLRNQ